MAVTVPLAGANNSLTALTDSTVPKLLPEVTSAPTRGSSTKTMSPKEFCAWSEMPIVAAWPSTFIHSCSFVYLRSAGYAIGFPFALVLRFLRTFVERRWYHLRRHALSAYFDLHFRADLGELWRHIGSRE